MVLTIRIGECFLFSQWKICFKNHTVTEIVFSGEDCSSGNSFLLDDGKRLLPKVSDAADVNFVIFHDIIFWYHIFNADKSFKWIPLCFLSMNLVSRNSLLFRNSHWGFDDFFLWFFLFYFLFVFLSFALHIV